MCQMLLDNYPFMSPSVSITFPGADALPDVQVDVKKKKKRFSKTRSLPCSKQSKGVDWVSELQPASSDEAVPADYLLFIWSCWAMGAAGTPLSSNSDASSWSHSWLTLGSSKASLWW